MTLRPVVLLVTALLGLPQCIMREGPDPEDRLPDATQTGQNTAGCRVDGLPWRAVQTSMFAGKPVRANWGPNPLGGRQLSLYLVHRIVEATGGTIAVDSQPGEGATFRIRFGRG